jgi:hypothetical protein
MNSFGPVAGFQRPLKCGFSFDLRNALRTPLQVPDEGWF